MEDNINNEDENIKTHSNRFEKSVTELFKEKELKIKWHKEILENASMQEHFKNFHPASIDSFISFYLIEKYFAYKYADSYDEVRNVIGKVIPGFENYNQNRCKSNNWGWAGPLQIHNPLRWL